MAGMTYTVPNADPSADAPPPPTILLQRLANPNLRRISPTTPGATYNPWVTVDYVDMQQVGTAASKNVVDDKGNKTSVNDARQYNNANGTNPNWTALGGTPQTPNYVQTQTNRFSFGRNQPYSGVVNRRRLAAAGERAAANPVRHARLYDCSLT